LFSSVRRGDAPADSFHALIRIGDYRRYVTAMLVSGLGDMMLLRVLGIVLVSQTGSSSAAGLIGFCLVVPALAGPVLGTAADRVAPRRLFVGLSLVMAVVVVVLTFIAMGTGEFWLLYLVVVAAGLASALTTSAEAGVVPGLVPPVLLGRANALLSTVAEGSRIIAPALGTLLLYRWLGVLPVAVIDAMSFFAVVLLIPTIRAKVMRTARVSGSDGESWTDWVRQSADGVRHLLRTAQLRPLLLGAYLAWAGIGFLETAIYATVLHGLHQPATFVALLGIAQGIGAIPAGLAAGVLTSRWGSPRLTAAGLLVVAIGTALFFTAVPAAVVAGAGVQAIGITWFFIGFGTALQQLTPPHLQGRAAGSAWAGLTVFQAGGILLGAGAGLVVDYRVLLAVIAVAALVGAIITARTRRPDAPVGN
jgi:MFS family permease